MTALVNSFCPHCFGGEILHKHAGTASVGGQFCLGMRQGLAEVLLVCQRPGLVVPSVWIIREQVQACVGVTPSSEDKAAIFVEQAAILEKYNNTTGIAGLSHREEWALYVVILIYVVGQAF